ncbi:pH-response regulator protein palI/prr-5 [Labeo rohita]|uniref:PH-response regulator protein palI/prr-5 n=1 Tax=Labeo rohita TaxID=84645 RepID=A0ABQ8N1P2_LABRO|nr:pH-response regulator protein palI/prr-5 [Labeo rohita]
MNTCLFFFIPTTIILSDDKDHGAFVMTCLCFCCSSSYFIPFVSRYMFKLVFIILFVAACGLQVRSILC